MKSNFSQPRIKKPNNIQSVGCTANSSQRKSSTHSKSNNKSKSRQRSSRSRSKSQKKNNQQQLSHTYNHQSRGGGGFSAINNYNSTCGNAQISRDFDRSSSKGKFQIKLVQNLQQKPYNQNYPNNNYNSTTASLHSNTKRSSLKKKLEHRKSGRESLDLTQIQQKQLQDRKRKYQMFEKTINNKEHQRKRMEASSANSDYEQDEERPKSSYSRSNSRSNRVLNNSSSYKKRRSRDIHDSSYKNTPLNQFYENVNTQESDDYEKDEKEYYSSTNKQNLKNQYDRCRPAKQVQNYHPVRMIHHNTSQTRTTSHQSSKQEDNQYYQNHRNYSEIQHQNNHNHSNSRSNDRSPSSYSPNHQMPQTMDQLQRQLAKYKSRCYDYKYKLDSLTSRLKESEEQAQKWKDKFDQEQDKTDEFFTKAEKYKILAKDFRKDNEQLKSEIEQIKHVNMQEIQNYETIIRLKDEKEARQNDQRIVIQQNLIESLRNLQLIAQQIDKNCQLIEPINQLFGHIQQISYFEDGDNGMEYQQLDSFRQKQQQQYQYGGADPVTQSQEGNQSINNQHHQMFYISEGKDQFKISSDAIMFNGESLNPDENFNQTNRKQMQNYGQNIIGSTSQQQLNSHQQQLTTQTDRQQEYQAQSQITPSTFKLYNNSVSDHNIDSHSQLPNMPPFTNNQNNLYTNQIHNISSQTTQQTATQYQQHQQYDLLVKIQHEMIQLREQSEKVLQENQALNEKNQRLTDELDQQKINSNNSSNNMQQSLMPQYKEAFEQLRKANENMQKKIEKLEQERLTQQQQNSQGLNVNKIENDLKDMQNQIQQITYENANLRSERDNFVQQIQNLENFNKNQEKMLKYFQQQQVQNSSNISNVSNSMNQPLKIQENYEASLQSQINQYQRKNSHNSLINSSSTTHNINNLNHSSNNLRQKMTRILDQQQQNQHLLDIDNNSNLNHQLAISEFSKSPNSQYFSNRTPTGGNNQDAFNQGGTQGCFTLNQVSSSDFNLTQSIMNKTNNSKSNGGFAGSNSVKGPGLTMTQFQPNGTESSLYIDTNANDKNEVIVLDQNDHIFSLSSTQPENQMRLSSPINYVARQIDFNLSNPNIQNGIGGGLIQHYQLNTGNFKQSTITTTANYSNLQINQYQQPFKSDEQNNILNIQPLSAQNQQNSRSRSPIDQLRVHEILQTQTQSQEVTNRDKSGGRQQTQSHLVQSTINKSNSDLSNSQLPCVQAMQNSSFLMQNNDLTKSSQRQQQLERDSSSHSYKLKSNLNDISCSAESLHNSNSDQSLEQHLIKNRVVPGHQDNSKHSSQETFQMKNINNGSANSSQYNHQIKPAHSLNHQNQQQYQQPPPPNQQYTTAQKHNKENMIMIEDDQLFKNNNHHHHYSQQSKILSSKVKSPAFYESNHMNSDSDTSSINNSNTLTQQENDNLQAIFNQQMVLDGLLIKQIQAVNNNNNGSQVMSGAGGDSGYCTTEKQNTLTSGFISGGLTSSMGISGYAQTTNNNCSADINNNSNHVNQLKLNTKNLTNNTLNGTNTSQSQNSNTNNANNANASVQSNNFMSERTMNLKKEITSLDEEILQLQNSLKQALIKKSNQLDETIE